MSAPTLTPLTDLTVGRIGCHAASFRAAHCDLRRNSITTAVQLAVPMSHEDIEAVFWRMLRDEGVTFADLADDGDACWYLLDALIGYGVAQIECYRMAIAQARPSDPEHAAIVRLRRRVEELFGPAVRPPRAAARTRRPARARGAPAVEPGEAGRGERSRGGNRAPLLVSHPTTPCQGHEQRKDTEGR